MRPELIGVSKTVKDFDVNTLTDDEQDQFIQEVLKGCAEDLRRLVMDARPLSEFVATVTGPHNDPIQGMIHVHTVAAHFDLDTLDTNSDAYQVHVGKAEGTTEGNTLDGGVFRD